MRTISFFHTLCIFFVSALLSLGAYAEEILLRTPFIPPQEEVFLAEEEVVLIRENSKIQNLQKQINERAEKLQATAEEIDGLNQQLQSITKTKDSLNRELKTLSLTSRKNEAQIRLTETGIETSRATLQQLDVSIEQNTNNLEVLNNVLRRNYQKSNEFEGRGLETILLGNDTFLNFLGRLEEVQQISKEIKRQFEDLEQESKALDSNRNQVVHERVLLERKQQELEDRKSIYQFSIEEKERLVNTTKNNEVTYQRLLDEKVRERLELQQELFAYESQIEYLRDPTTLPTPKKGLLKFPFEGNPTLTQGFGRTAFSIRNARRYGRDTHNGLDWALSTGSKLFASADGVVKGTGNTDLVPSCQAWGKWVVVEHEFGLSTLYAHLSFIKVRIGQKVKTGDLLGYSGNTGFSTGPHLHFGVYDTKGLRIVPYEQISSSRRCRGLIMPVSAEAANIDPGLYLP